MKRPSIKTCSKAGLMKLVDAMHYSGDDAAKRRTLIFAAGVANNKKLLRELGSLESAGWFEGRRMADPNTLNPYWPDKG